MATTQNFIEYVCEQLDGIGDIRYRKMFGEYLIYLNDKPVLTVCDNIVYVKQLECIANEMQSAKTGFPYEGTKEHYILDVDNADFAKNIILKVESVTPLPKKRAKKPKTAEN